MLTHTIKGITFIFVLSLWAPLGLYVAIPAILVSFLSYVFGVMISAFVGERALLKLTEKLVEDAVTMYPNGYRAIYRSVYDSEGEETRDDAEKHDGTNRKKEQESVGAFGSFLMFILGGLIIVGFATLFWWLIYLAANYFGFTVNFAELLPFQVTST